MVTPTLPVAAADVLEGDSGWPQRPPLLRELMLAVVRRHRLVTAVAAVGVVLRVLVEAAYPPALEFFGDSYSYLRAAQHLGHVDIWHPFGYPLVLRLLSVTHSLAAVTVVQHAAGVGAGLLVYRLVREHGVGGVGATAAAAPLLLDAYQFDVEQFVLSDTMFTLLVVIAVRMALRVPDRARRGVGPVWTAAVLGLVLALATLTRTVGLAVALVVGVVLALRRVGWRPVVAAAGAFAVPLVLYAAAFASTYGVFGLQGYSGRYLYGTVAHYADCRGLDLPPRQRVLCDPLPVAARPGLNEYVWEAGPFQRLAGSEIRRSDTAGRFARAVALHQPAATVRTVADTVAHYFAPGRSTGLRDWFVASWQFPLREQAPAWHIEPAEVGFDQSAEHGHVVVGPARLLRGYQRVGFVPGPVLLLCTLAALVALVLRRLPRRTRSAIALTMGAGLALLLVPSASAGFDWRYALPADPLLVAAGVLGVDAIRSRVVVGGLRRGVTAVIAVLVVGATAVGWAAPSAPPSGEFRPTMTLAAPATLPIGDRLTVRVGRPDVRTTGCAATPRGYRITALAAFPVAIGYVSGGSILVQANNFALTGAGALSGPTIPGSSPVDVLRPVVLSSRWRNDRGTVYMDVPAASGRLEYVDSGGAGAAAWSFAIPQPRRGPALGTRCTPVRHHGPLLAAPRVDPLPAFTELDTVHVGYRGADNGTLAVSYDVRWRQGSSQSAYGPWQYPPTWQQTAGTTESLVGLAPGASYCFSIRALDLTGNPTAWSPPTCTTRLYDDGALTVAPPWQQVRDQPGFYYGTYTRTTASGASISVAGTYTHIGLVAYRCPTCGTVAVYAGKTLVQVLTLRSSAHDAGLMSWMSPVLPRRHGIVTLRAVSRDRAVVIDALGLLR